MPDPNSNQDPKKIITDPQHPYDKKITIFSLIRVILKVKKKSVLCLAAIKNHPRHEKFFLFSNTTVDTGRIYSTNENSEKILITRQHAEFWACSGWLDCIAGIPFQPDRFSRIIGPILRTLHSYRYHFPSILNFHSSGELYLKNCSAVVLSKRSKR
jgi:hypothetical protein